MQLYHLRLVPLTFHKKTIKTISKKKDLYDLLIKLGKKNYNEKI